MPPPIYFYLPDPVPAEMPQSPEVFWPDFRRYMRGGVYAWIVQTFQHLRDAGLACELTNRLPVEGILVAHRKSLPRDFVAPRGVLFVCVRADATFHPFAHLHVVLNRRALSSWFPSFYMPHWPQPGLLPRDTARGDAWKNAAFFGDPVCFAGEISGSAWEATLQELGLKWHLVPPEKWHDFRETDVVVAVRSFDRHRHENKPPTKLFNAWHAGVPAVLGRESAYQQERRAALDYLEVNSFTEVVGALRRLKANPQLRQAMVANGFERARESDPAVITARWQEFFETVAAPSFEIWRNPSRVRQAFWLVNGWLKTKAQDWRERLWH
jgi:hypothetical protein